MESTISMWAGMAQVGIALAITAMGIRIVFELRKAEIDEQVDAPSEASPAA